MIFLLLPVGWGKGQDHNVVAALCLTSAALIMIFVGKAQTSSEHSIFSDRQILIPLGALFVLLAAGTFLQDRATGFGTAQAVVSPLLQMRAQGALGVFSLLLANALWLVVDISTWQRIASVKAEHDPGGKPVYPLEALRKGTLRVAFESPGTWLLGIVFGWLIQTSGVLPPGVDAYEGVSRLVLSLTSGALQLPRPLSAFNWIVYPLLITSAVSIMFSTVNALLSTISFTAYCDLPPFRGVMRSSGQHLDVQIRPARVWTIVILCSGLILYPAIRFLVGTQLATFLYTAYSAQLALFPAVCLSLLRRNLSRTAATASIIGGILLACVGGGLATIINDPTFAVLPPLFAVLGSSAFYVFFYRAPKPNATEAPVTGTTVE